MRKRITALLLTGVLTLGLLPATTLPAPAGEEHLRRQLMGGGEDNRLRAADIHIQLFKNGQKICQGLAGACFGTTDDILAG